MRGLLFTVAVVALGLGVGCKKKPQPVVATPPTVVAPPSTNYTPGGSAAFNALQAAKRVATQVEMANLGVLIESAYTETGKMPDLDVIKKQVKQGTPNLYAAIEDGSVILCWTTQHDGVWAYQTGADKHGGLALVSGSARRVTADEMRDLLAGK